MIKEIIKINNLSKKFYDGNNQISILKDVNFSIAKGDIISISGPSGSGKSTFLNILGLLDSYFEGDYQFLNRNIKSLNIKDKNSIRNQSIGFVHQFFHLIPELNVLENVLLPHLIYHNKYKTSLDTAKEILINFNLRDRMHANTNTLSGGEQQRVAIARALINNPEMIIADEMTGNLDKKTADSVFDFFLEKIKHNKQTLIYVTHNNHYAKKANNLYQISQQQLIRYQ
jgi:ABC-type lipoprotein export system ATPase subunit